jgi:hypothetical protein
MCACFCACGFFFQLVLFICPPFFFIHFQYSRVFTLYFHLFFVGTGAVVGSKAEDDHRKLGARRKDQQELRHFKFGFCTFNPFPDDVTNKRHLGSAPKSHFYAT